MSNARKILIVDDDDELRDSLSEQLSLHEEFDTALAANATEGFKQARNGHVDLVLLDVGLPDLDGREACKLLRRGGFKGPVIMLTAQTSDSDTILGLGVWRQRLCDQALPPRRVAGTHPRAAQAA